MMSIGFMVMEPNPVFKHCNPEHNIATGAKDILIGTLEGFRKIEKQKLADAGEGMYYYNIDIAEPISADWATKLTKDLETHNGNYNVSNFDWKNRKLQFEKFQFNSVSLNAWVFCMSLSGVIGTVADYTSCWKLDGNKIHTFSIKIAQLIKSSLTFEMLPDEVTDVVPIEQLPRRLGIEVRHRQIGYLERDVTLTSEGDLPINQIDEWKESIAFTKPISYFSEDEYRFIFYLTLDGNRVSVPNQDLLLTLDPIRALTVDSV
jgi:hypothetical protein